MKTTALIFALHSTALLAVPLFAQPVGTWMAVGSGPLSSETAKDNRGKVDKRDARFVAEVLKINDNEGVIAKLVAERAITREVGDLARQLASDLDASTRELRSIAEKKGIPLPDPRSEAGDLKYWNEKDPKTLDADYLKRVKDVLDELADHYRKTTEKSSDPELVAFAKKLLAAVGEQRRRADQVRPTPAPPPEAGSEKPSH